MTLPFPILWVRPVRSEDLNAGAFVDVANCVGDGPESDEGWEFECAVFVYVLSGDVLLGRVVSFQFVDVVLW